MKLGVEARNLYTENKTGIPNYAWNILLGLKEVLPDLELYLYIPSGFTREPLSRLGDFTLRQRPPYFGMKGYFWTKFFAGKLVREDDLDVFLAPRTLYPLGIHRTTPVVSVLHDLCHLLYPQVMPAGTLLNDRLWLRHDVRHASKVVAVSEGTSQRMAEFLGRTADAITPPAVGGEYQPASMGCIKKLCARFELTQPYILFVGTLEPRKNLEALIDALPLVNAHRDSPITLVLAGRRGWRNKNLVARLDAGVPNVVEIGYVPDADLPALYSGSEAFVIPSIYEGFGMPAAEARACGTRVVATDIPELHEAAGPNATYVAPTPQGIAEGIERALDKPRPMPERDHSWRDSAILLAEVLKEAARSKGKTV